MAAPRTAGSIRAAPRPRCDLCGAPGRPLYAGLHDRWFDAPGSGFLKRCANARCGVLWLDPMPVEADLAHAYQTYSTHADTPYLANILRRGVPRLIQDAYLATKYGYGRRPRTGWQRSLGAGASRMSSHPETGQRSGGRDAECRELGASHFRPELATP